MNYTRAQVGGRLTRDPELRYTAGGSAVASCSFAVNTKYLDAGGAQQERVDFIDVTLFGKRAEAFARFHKKGATAFVEGRLRLDQWEDKHTGAKRQKLYVVADNWEFVGSRESQEAHESEPAASPRRSADAGYAVEEPF